MEPLRRLAAAPQVGKEEEEDAELLLLASEVGD